jgi:hypothetical protein
MDAASVNPATTHQVARSEQGSAVAFCIGGL